MNKQMISASKLVFMFVFVSFSMLFSQDIPLDSVGPRWVNMYPLEKGNYWVYKESGLHYSTERVVEDTIIYNKQFFTIERTDDGQLSPINYVRVDSKGIVQLIRSNVDTTVFPVLWLNVSIGDSIPAYNPGDFWVVTEIYLDSNDKMNVTYEYSSQILGGKIWMLEGIGEVESGGEGAIDVLQGAYIDGVLIGDTNIITGMDDPEDSFKVKKFYLSQNYPNPFNPQTTIKFSVPKPSHVKIEIYNIKGQKVQTLANKRMNRGTYEAVFDGSNLASGIYVYRMIAGDITAVKKMILMK